MPPRSPGLQHAVALLAMLVLMLGSGLRGAAIVSDGGVAAPIVGAPICHAGKGQASGPDHPADPSDHACCDACTLGGATPASPVPDLMRPVAVERGAEHADGLGWAPVLARLRSPQQSRGPPAA